MDIQHKTTLQSLTRHRLALMGMAMLMVLVYHGPKFAHGNRFVIGYIGVDIFLFISGLGLCYSYERNTLRRFYQNRLVRIMPLFVMMFVIADCVNGEFSIPLFFSQITTYNYFTSSPNPYDWYLTALLLLYAVFPLLYVVVRKIGGWSKLSYLLAVVLILAYNAKGGG